MKTLALTGFQELFKTTIHKWLQILYEKSCEKIHKVVEVEQVLTATMSVNFHKCLFLNSYLKAWGRP